jgi:hypothetical protein
MASVKIYPSHAPLVARLVTSANTRSAAAAAATGPFQTLREAYIFAASLGIAAGTAIDAGAMEKFKEGPGHAISENVFFVANGAEELVTLMAMLPEGTDTEVTDDLLTGRIGELGNEDYTERFESLDRYAYAGFEIIAGEDGDLLVRDTLLACLAKIKPEAHGEGVLADIDAVEAYLFT